MKALKSLLLAFGLVGAMGAQAALPQGFDACPQHFPAGGAPKVGAAVQHTLRQLCFDAFAVAHSAQAKTPLYVVEKLSRASLLDARDEKRADRFYEEARLPSAERALLADYKSTLDMGGAVVKFDRGHLAPAADMPTAQANAQSFSLANMAPQLPNHNRGPWADIEKVTRQYVMRARGDVFVFTGIVHQNPVPKLGPSQVWVPAVFYKLVYDPEAGRAWAHWLPNVADARVKPPISYAELVQRTGIEFLPGATVH